MFSITSTSGSFQTAARLRPSWKSPVDVPPSPMKLIATRSEPFCRSAKAQPVATGIIEPRWLIMPTCWIPAGGSK
ncbi:MAG: hypothetical protein R2862_03670 [Thermoanaerobaculia bacterium]